MNGAATGMFDYDSLALRKKYILIYLWNRIYMNVIDKLEGFEVKSATSARVSFCVKQGCHFWLCSYHEEYVTNWENSISNFIHPFPILEMHINWHTWLSLLNFLLENLTEGDRVFQAMPYTIQKYALQLFYNTES